MAATECEAEGGDNFIRFVGGVCSGEEVEGEYVGDDVTSGKCYNYGLLLHYCTSNICSEGLSNSDTNGIEVIL